MQTSMFITNGLTKKTSEHNNIHLNKSNQKNIISKVFLFFSSIYTSMDFESLNITTSITSQNEKLSAKSSIADLFDQINLQNLNDEINDTIYYKCTNKIDLMIIEKTSQTIREFMKFCNSNLFEDGKRNFLIEKFKGNLKIDFLKTNYYDLQIKKWSYYLTLNIKSIKDNSINWSFMNIKNANCFEKDAYYKDIDMVKFIIRANVYLFNFKLYFIKMLKSKIDEFNNIIDKLKDTNSDVILQIFENFTRLFEEFRIIYNEFLDKLSLEKNTLKLVEAKNVFAVLNDSSSHPEIVEKTMNIFNEFTGNLLSGGLLTVINLFSSLHEMFSHSYKKMVVIAISKYFSLQKRVFLAYVPSIDDINYKILDTKSVLNKDNKDLANDIVKFCIEEYFIGDEKTKINSNLNTVYEEFIKLIQSIKNFKCNNCGITHFIQLESNEKTKEKFITTYLENIDYLIRYQSQTFIILEFLIYIIRLYCAKDDLKGNITWNYYLFNLTSKWQTLKDNVLNPNQLTDLNVFERNIMKFDFRYKIKGENMIVSFLTNLTVFFRLFQILI